MWNFREFSLHVEPLEIGEFPGMAYSGRPTSSCPHCSSGPALCLGRAGQLPSAHLWVWEMGERPERPRRELGLGNPLFRHFENLHGLTLCAQPVGGVHPWRCVCVWGSCGHVCGSSGRGEARRVLGARGFVPNVFAEQADSFYLDFKCALGQGVLLMEIIYAANIQ